MYLIMQNNRDGAAEAMLPLAACCGSGQIQLTEELLLLISCRRSKRLRLIRAEVASAAAAAAPRTTPADPPTFMVGCGEFARPRGIPGAAKLPK